MTSLQYPVVLINGVIFPQSLGPMAYFHQLEMSYPEVTFKTINLPPFGTQKTRMEILVNELKSYPAKEFHIIGHSQGGIEARLLLENPEFRSRIKTIVSINSPFKGTSVLTYFPFLKKQWKHLIELQHASLTAQHHVPHFCANSYIKNVEEFKHYPMFKWLEPRIRPIDGLNDGFVGLESMRMGEEIILEDGDHLSNIGWPMHIGHHLMGAMNPHIFFDKILKHLSQWETRR